MDSLPAEPPGKPFHICYLPKNPVRESRNRHRLENKCMDAKGGRTVGGIGRLRWIHIGY